MAYKLIITENADRLLDDSVFYLTYRIRNEQAARHLLNEISGIYIRLEENPFQFPLSRDWKLKNKGYREAVVGDMSYLVIYKIEEKFVYILGVFIN